MKTFFTEHLILETKIGKQSLIQSEDPLPGFGDGNPAWNIILIAAAIVANIGEYLARNE